MPTIYEETPSFQERVIGSLLIIEGRIEKAFDVNVDRSGENIQVQTIFRVKVENILKGKTAEESVIVRVVGGRAEGIETDWSLKLKEGDQILLMLAPDYGPNQTKNMFVPYFSTCYWVTGEDRVKLDRNVTKELGNQIEIRKGTTDISNIRSIISTIVKHSEEKIKALNEMEPAEYRETPYGEINEMPPAPFKGAKSIKPGRARTTTTGGRTDERRARAI